MLAGKNGEPVILNFNYANSCVGIKVLRILKIPYNIQLIIYNPGNIRIFTQKSKLIFGEDDTK